MNVKRLHENAILPKYAHVTDSGFDLCAVEDAIIEPGETALIKTGLAFDIPKGYEIQVRPRSGVTLKTKLRVQFGTIDSGYRGEVGVIVDNINTRNLVGDNYLIDIRDNLVNIWDWFDTWSDFEKGSYVIRKGDRIAQGVIAPVGYPVFEEVDNLTESDRGENGYGSTGVKESDLT